MASKKNNNTNQKEACNNSSHSKQSSSMSSSSSSRYSPSASATSSYSTINQDDQWSVNSRRPTNRNKELTAVSKLVKKKLEDYMNKEKREMKFDPNGYLRTTKRMYKYDLAYKLLEATNMEKRDVQIDSRGSNETSSTSISAITPRLHPNTSKDGITLVREAERLSASANNIFQSLPMNKLATVHGYKPDPKLTKSVENGKVQNYTMHVGAALNTDAYVQYYLKAGLGGHRQRSESRSSDEEEEKTTHHGNRRKSKLSNKSRYEVQHSTYKQHELQERSDSQKNSKTNRKKCAQNSSQNHSNNPDKCVKKGRRTKRPKTGRRRVDLSDDDDLSDSQRDKEEDDEEENGSEEEEEEEGKEEEEEPREGGEEEANSHDKDGGEPNIPQDSSNEKPDAHLPKKLRKKSKSRKSSKKDHNEGEAAAEKDLEEEVELTDTEDKTRKNRSPRNGNGEKH